MSSNSIAIALNFDVTPAEPADVRKGGNQTHDAQTTTWRVEHKFPHATFTAKSKLLDDHRLGALAAAEHLVDQAVFQRFVRRQNLVALDVF